MDRTLLLSMLLSQLCWSVSLDLEYHFIDEKMSWSQAQSHCRDHFTDLASVNDMKDLKNLKAAANGRTDAWIGLQFNISLIEEAKKKTKKNWHWSQPTVRYEEGIALWDGIEPNNPETEKCVLINNKDNNNWSDQSCEHKASCFICYNETSNTTVMMKVKEDDKKTWLEAQRYCRTNHTDLMSGLDQQRQIKDSITHCWIGLFRHIWSWSDRSDSSFRNWKSVESLNQKDLKCATLGENGQWESDKCEKEKTFICHGDGPFVLVKENRTFEEALIHCRHNYHDLAWSIDKEPWKSEALKEIQKAKSEFVWVGLHFACFFEEWFWVDGKYVSATNDNWKNSVEGKCGDVAAVKKKDNKWYKENLGKKYNFICKRSCPCNG